MRKRSGFITPLVILGALLFTASHFRRRMAERWENMTPEERERFRQGMCGRRGCGPSTSESNPRPSS